MGLDAYFAHLCKHTFELNFFPFGTLPRISRCIRRIDIVTLRQPYVILPHCEAVLLPPLLPLIYPSPEKASEAAASRKKFLNQRISGHQWPPLKGLILSRVVFEIPPLCLNYAPFMPFPAAYPRFREDRQPKPRRERAHFSLMSRARKYVAFVFSWYRERIHKRRRNAYRVN